MSLIPTLADILETKYTPSLNDYFKNIDIWVNIYVQSIIDVEEYSKACAYITAKSSNDLNVVEQMPYYKFNNMMIHLREIIENENGGSGEGSGEGNQDFKSMAKSQMNSSMSQAGKMMNNIPK